MFDNKEDDDNDNDNDDIDASLNSSMVPKLLR